MKESFGSFIKKLRVENNLTLTQLAAKLDLDSANLSKIENGKRDFDEKRLVLLSDTFKIEIDELKKEYFGDFIARKIYDSIQNDMTPDELQQDLVEKRKQEIKQELADAKGVAVTSEKDAVDLEEKSDELKDKSEDDAEKEIKKSPSSRRTDESVLPEEGLFFIRTVLFPFLSGCYALPNNLVIFRTAMPSTSG